MKNKTVFAFFTWPLGICFCLVIIVCALLAAIVWPLLVAMGLSAHERQTEEKKKG